MPWLARLAQALMLAFLSGLIFSGPVFAVGEAGLIFDVVTTEDAGFFANSVILQGEHETMLVDAQLTKSGAEKVLNRIRKSGKELTLIYITHSHADHFLGLEVFKAAYPNVKIIAVPEVVKGIRAVYQQKLDKWHSILGKDGASQMVDVSEYDQNVIHFDNVAIEIIRHVTADTADSTMLWIPSRKTLVSSDVTFIDMHVYTPETDLAARKSWLSTLQRIRKLQPAMVIPGHNKVGVPLDATTAVDFTEKYLTIFDEELSQSGNPEELIARMKLKFPSAGLLLSIERGAAASFANRR